MTKTYMFGQFVDVQTRVVLRPIRHLSTDLRSRHLFARWDRLTRRWIRRTR